jgi:hypothetical protein
VRTYSNSGLVDINLLAKNINTIRRNMDALLWPTKEVGLEIISREKEISLYVHVLSTKCRTESWEYDKVQIFEKKIVANKNCIHEEIKSRLNSGNTWYQSV